MIKKVFGFIGKGINRLAAGVQKGLYLFDKLPPAVQDKIVERSVDVGGGVRKAYSPPVKKFIEEHGDEVIHKLGVRREPIQGAINTALNLVTLGRFEKAKQAAGYDKMFHLSLVVNDKYVIEKNEVVNFGAAKPKGTGVEEMSVPLNGATLTIKQLLDRAQVAMGDDDFFLYSAFGGRNCQNFIDGVLKHNGLLTDAIHRFLFQPIGVLLEHLPSYTNGLANVVTKLGALVDVARFGRE